MSGKALININLPEMAYVLGTIYSDGSICFTQRTWKIQLNVKDLDYMEEFVKCISKLLDKSPPYPYYFINKTGLYQCGIASYNLGSYIHNTDLTDFEAIKKYPAYFLRGLYDGDGGANFYNKKRKNGHTHNVLRIGLFNTDIDLLKFAQKLLKENFNINSKLRLHGKARGEIIIKGYRTNNSRPVYTLSIDRQSEILKFNRFVGFSIQRKTDNIKKFIDAVERRKNCSYWSEEEVGIMKRYYPTSSMREMRLLLPNRESKAILTKAERLGIKKKFIIQENKRKVSNPQELMDYAKEHGVRASLREFKIDTASFYYYKQRLEAGKR